MVPAKATQSSKKISSLSSPTLTQGRLSFSSAKRTAAAAGNAKAKSGGKASVTSSPRVVAPVENEEAPPTTDNSSESESEDEPVVVTPKRRATRALAREVQVVEPREGGDLDELERSGRLSKPYGSARALMGNLPPVHAEGQSKAYQILRVFDNTFEYGPCIGATRLERWERAHALGLNPPAEVREILLTKLGMEDDHLKHTVYYDHDL